jgi:hypothetical protein
MPKIEYRPYQPSDANDVKNLVSQAFSVDRYVKAPRLLSGAKDVYLRTCLTASNYTQVANNKRMVRATVGNSGRLRHRPLTYRHPVHIQGRHRNLWERLRLICFGAFDNPAVQFGHYFFHVPIGWQNVG